MQYVVKSDHHPAPAEDSLLLSLNQGDVVEILDSSINGKWFVRAQSGSGGVAHGWFPSTLLERVERGGEEEVDGRKPWIQITAGNRCYAGFRESVLEVTQGRGLIYKDHYVLSPPSLSEASYVEFPSFSFPSP